MKSPDFYRLFITTSVTAIMAMSGWALKTTADTSRDISVLKVQVSGLKEQVSLTYSAVAADGDRSFRALKDAEQDRRLEVLETQMARRTNLVAPTRMYVPVFGPP